LNYKQWWWTQACVSFDQYQLSKTVRRLLKCRDYLWHVTCMY